MLFKPYLAEAIIRGEKTQTRRLLPPSGCATVLRDGTITEVYRNHRLLWEVRKTYAIQPGRGKKAIARFHLLTIRLQPLQAITAADATAEGLAHPNPIQAFARLWNDIHSAPGTRWQDNPNVLALTFELATPRSKE